MWKKDKLNYKPKLWWLFSGGIGFIMITVYYIHLRGICGRNVEAGENSCPFADWFNHNAFMHVALIPVLWVLGIGWAGNDEKMKNK